MKKLDASDYLIEICNCVICLYETMKDDEDHGLLIRDFYEEVIRDLKKLAAEVLDDSDYESFIFSKQGIHERIREDELDGKAFEGTSLHDALVDFIGCLQRSCPNDSNYYRLKVLKSGE